MIRLTDEEIARALETQKIFKGYDLSGAISDGDRAIAKAQLKKVLADLVRIDGGAENLKILEENLTEYILALKKEVEDG